MTKKITLMDEMINSLSEMAKGKWGIVHKLEKLGNQKYKCTNCHVQYERWQEDRIMEIECRGWLNKLQKKIYSLYPNNELHNL